MQKQHHQCNLTEGLRTGDLKGMVSHKIDIDRYKSKMGEDSTIVVVSLTVNDKFPAIDLMEFIEKGYPFVLDADMSTGEEASGNYSVFIELERTNKVGDEVHSLLRGIGQLCDITNWKFKYFKETLSHEFSVDVFNEIVPLSKEAYLAKVNTQKLTDVNSILDKGPAEVVAISENNTITFRKPYSSDFSMKIERIGKYTDLVESLKGAVQLDEASNGQTLFLEKYLGNYVIHKINNQFLIKNGDNALILSKSEW